MVIPPEVFIPFLFITGLIYIGCIGMFCFRWDKFPIKQRLPSLVLFEQLIVATLGIIFLTAGLASQEELSLHCSSFYLFIVVSFDCCVLVMTFRVLWVLLRDFGSKKIIDQYCQHLNSFNDEFDDREELRKSSKVGQGKILFIFLNKASQHFNYYSIISFMMSPTLCLALIDISYVSARISSLPVNQDSTTALSNCTSIVQFSSFFRVSFLSVCMLGTVLLMFPLSKVRDNFFVRRELKMVLILNVIVSSCVCVVLEKNLMNFLLIETRIWPFLVGAFVSPASVIVQSGFPVVMSFLNEKEIKNDPSGSADALSNSKTVGMSDLQDALTHKETRDLFVKFLQSEFSVENLIFYFSCLAISESFEKGNSLEVVVQQYRFVRDKFILETSEFPINISSKCRNSLKLKLAESSLATATFDELNPGLLDPAKEEVFNLMARDSFTRFRRTPEYRQATQSPMQKLSNNAIQFLKESAHVLSDDSKHLDMTESLKTPLIQIT
jgi:hypothetical protein